MAQTVRQQILIFRNAATGKPFVRFDPMQEKVLAQYVAAGFEFVSATTLHDGALLMLAKAPIDTEPPEVDPVEAQARGIDIGFRMPA